MPTAKEIDVLAPPVIISLNRFQSFDYVGVADDETSALLTPALTEISPISSTVRPFSTTVSKFLLNFILMKGVAEMLQHITN